MSRLIEGLIAVAVGLVALFFVTEVGGMVLDGFMVNFMPLMSGVSDDFTPTQNMIGNFTSLFYFIPIIFVVLFFAWLFKLIFVKHPYTYEEEEYRW